MADPFRLPPALRHWQHYFSSSELRWSYSASIGGFDSIYFCWAQIGGQLNLTVALRQSHVLFLPKQHCAWPIVLCDHDRLERGSALVRAKVLGQFSSGNSRRHDGLLAQYYTTSVVQTINGVRRRLQVVSVQLCVPKLSRSRPPERWSDPSAAKVAAGLLLVER
jgi:hypothetical protein